MTIRRFVLLLACLLAVAPAAQAAGPAPQLEDEIRSLTLDRAGRRGADLPRDPILTEIARAHSRAMHARDKLAHELDGLGPDDRLARQHRRLFGLISENVAMQSGFPAGTDPAALLVEGWMNSPGHRRNILASYQVFEVGCYGHLWERSPDRELPDDEGARSRSGDRSHQRQIMYCTQLFVREPTYLADDVAYRQPANGELILELASGADDAAARVSLSPPDDAGTSQGTAWQNGAARLPLPPQPGIHRLRLWLQQQDDASRYRIIPGPYVCVVPGAACQGSG